MGDRLPYSLYDKNKWIYQVGGTNMNVIATVEISNASFEEWVKFFESYESQRMKFVENEVVTKISGAKAEVRFTITDIEGLTALSSSELVRDGETRLGIEVALSAAG